MWFIPVHRPKHNGIFLSRVTLFCPLDRACLRSRNSSSLRFRNEWFYLKTRKWGKTSMIMYAALKCRCLCKSMKITYAIFFWNNVPKCSVRDSRHTVIVTVLQRLWCIFVRASLYKRREENQLDGTECFIALIICSTSFGYLYAHHQELETILVLLPHMVCNVLLLTAHHQQPRHYTPYVAITQV